MKKALLALKSTTILVGVLLLIGLGIKSSKGMPDYAKVSINVFERTYLAPPCVSNPAGLRVITAGEARKLGYKPDSKCRDEGAFMQDDRSITGMIFQRIGVLKPIKSRWNEDGSWNY